MGSTSLRAAIVAVALAVAWVAGAAPHPRVHLTIDPCVPVAAGEVRRILAIELGALFDGDDTATEPHALASISCGPRVPGDRRGAAPDGAKEGSLILRVDDPVTQKSLEREVDLLGAAAESRARLLGLAVAELISASWSELIVSPAPRVAPAGPSPSSESRAVALAAVTRAPPGSALLRPRLCALASGLGLFAGTGLVGGGGLRVGMNHRYHLGWWVDAQAGHASSGTSLGEVSTDLVAIGAALVGQQSWSRVGLSGGIGFRGGAVRFAGAPRDESSAVGHAAWGGWAGPMATLGLLAAPVRRLALEVGLETGYVVAPVAGLVDGRRELGVSGAWVAFQVGVGVFL